jgi:hypothetical protein
MNSTSCVRASTGAGISMWSDLQGSMRSQRRCTGQDLISYPSPLQYGLLDLKLPSVNDRFAR